MVNKIIIIGNVFLYVLIKGFEFMWDFCCFNFVFKYHKIIAFITFILLDNYASCNLISLTMLDLKCSSVSNKIIGMWNSISFHYKILFIKINNSF